MAAVSAQQCICHVVPPLLPSLHFVCLAHAIDTSTSIALCHLQPKHVCSGFAAAESGMVLGASESPDSQVWSRLTGFVLAVLTVVVVAGCVASACCLRGSGQRMLALHLGG